LDQDTLIKLRKVEVEILDEFVQICEENNLVYFITSGTLIGAVRHKGFIPWDDDIDVAMPRKDYDTFIHIFQNNSCSNYYLLSYETTNNIIKYYEPFAKLCKKDTLFIDINNTNNSPGIFIDIWPFDNCILFLAPLQTKLVKFFWRFFRMSINVDIPKKNKTIFLLNLFLFFFPNKMLNKLHNFLNIIFNKYNTRHISFFSGRYGYKKETHRYDIIFPLTKIYFEGKYYCAPGNWDAYLKNEYGNYMEIPPVEQQVCHEPVCIIFSDKEQYKSQKA